jgi:hypothetical protein
VGSLWTQRKITSLTPCILGSFKQHIRATYSSQILLCGTGGSVVINTVCYKSEGRGFETRWGKLFFSPIYLIFPAALSLSLVSTIEELLGRKISGSGLESREYGRRDPSRWPRGTLYQQKLALTVPTSAGRSVSLVRSRTKPTEFVCFSRPHQAMGFTQPLTEISTRSRKMFLGVERCGCIGLTKLPPSVNRLSRQCGILNISQLYRPPRPVTGMALLYGDGVCFLWGTNWTVSTATSSQ